MDPQSRILNFCGWLPHPHSAVTPEGRLAVHRGRVGHIYGVLPPSLNSSTLGPSTLPRKGSQWSDVPAGVNRFLLHKYKCDFRTQSRDISSTNPNFPAYKGHRTRMVFSPWMGPSAYGPGRTWKQTSPGFMPSPQALFPGLQTAQAHNLALNSVNF